MESMTNIMVDKPVKKAKTSSCGQHGAKAKGSELAPLCTMLSQVSLIPSNSMGGSHMHYMNGNLPPQLLQDRNLANPWLIPDENLMQTLQIIVTTVVPSFQDLTDICPGTAIFQLAAQCLCVLHSNFSSTALALVGHFLALNPSDNAAPPTGPEIIDTTGLKEYGVKGAISLCCSVLECTITLYKNGDIEVNDQISIQGKPTTKTPLKFKKEPSSIMFCEQHWGPITQQYHVLIAKCDHTALKAIIAIASALNPLVMGVEDGSF
ncbi:hypothetical protein V8B97DRAFT_2025111 [Scleroderma yunnanense]